MICEAMFADIDDPARFPEFWDRYDEINGTDAMIACFHGDYDMGKVAENVLGQLYRRADSAP